jgi:hypothetical protein
MHKGAKGLAYLMGVGTLCLGGRVEDDGGVDLTLTQFAYVSSSQLPSLGSCVI